MRSACQVTRQRRKQPRFQALRQQTRFDLSLCSTMGRRARLERPRAAPVPCPERAPTDRRAYAILFSRAAGVVRGHGYMTEPPSRQYEAYKANGWPNEVAECAAASSSCTPSTRNSQVRPPRRGRRRHVRRLRRLPVARLVRPESVERTRLRETPRLRHGRHGRQHPRRLRRVAVAGSA